MEDYFFDTDYSDSSDKVYVLVIYDITDNKKRNRLAKILLGYGFRIQKSAFEAEIREQKYHQLLKELEPYGSKEDSVRVYKIIGKGQVTVFGENNTDISIEDVILI